MAKTQDVLEKRQHVIPLKQHEDTTLQKQLNTLWAAANLNVAVTHCGFQYRCDMQKLFQAPSMRKENPEGVK